MCVSCVAGTYCCHGELKSESCEGIPERLNVIVWQEQKLQGVKKRELSNFQ